MTALPLPVHPFDFSEALSFLDGFKAAEAIERFALAGGMPRYLAEFSLHQPLKSLIAQRVLNRLGPLFNEPRALLAQELVAPHNYFSILAALSYGPHS